MKRKLLTFFSALSLFFFVVVCVLWVRSRSPFHWVVWSGSHRVYVHAAGGRLGLEWRDAQFYRNAGEMDEVVDESSREWGLGGFVTARWGGRYVALSITDGFLLITFAILPSVSVGRAFLHRRRHRPGLCPHCGYDLRATPDRCPECGRSASEKVQSQVEPLPKNGVAGQ